MSRHPRNDLAVQDFAKAMKKITRTRPTNAKDIERWAWVNRNVSISDEGLRKALVGDVDPTGVSPELLMVLVDYFEVKPEAFGQYAAERINIMRGFACMGTGPSEGGDLQNPSTGCTDRTADQGTRDATVLQFRAG